MKRISYHEDTEKNGFKKKQLKKSVKISVFAIANPSNPRLKFSLETKKIISKHE